MLPIRLGTVNADGAAGAVRLRADAQRPGRDDELPHGAAADRRGRCPCYVQGRVPAVLPGDVRRAGQARGHARGVPRVRVGHELVRSVRGRPALAPRSCASSASSGSPERGVARIGATGCVRQPGGPVDVFVTRLHVRYDAAHFPEDLVFQETADRSNFQGRYVLRHPWKGEAQCEAAARYRDDRCARAPSGRPALSPRSPAGPSRRFARRWAPSPKARRMAVGGGRGSSGSSVQRASASSSLLRTAGHSAGTIE